MSAASSAPPVPDAEVNEYLHMWAEQMGQVLTQIAGAPYTMESALAAPPETPAPEENDLQASVAAAGSLRGEMRLRVPRAVVLAVGQLFLQESQDAAAELKPDHRDALQGLLRQTAGQLVTALSARWGETQLRVEAGAASSWAAGARGWQVSAPGAPSRLLLEWQLSSALVAALRPPRRSCGEANHPISRIAFRANRFVCSRHHVDLILNYGDRLSRTFEGAREEDREEDFRSLPLPSLLCAEKWLAGMLTGVIFSSLGPGGERRV